MSVLTLIALATIVVVEEEGSSRDDATLPVPRARAVLIDGTVDEEEWRGSVVVRRPEGELLLRHDGKYLYVGVRANRRGFASVCFARGNTVRVAHASFALGEVAYTRSGGSWNLRAPFEWTFPPRTLGPHVDRSRARFLAEHGWIGSTVPMGDPRHAEMQIALDQFDPRDLRIGVAFFLEDEGRGEGIGSWAAVGARAGGRDACADNRLVRGYPPERLTFRTKAWTKLTLAPSTSEVKRSPKRSSSPRTAVA